jgi:hypothetical protein
MTASAPVLSKSKAILLAEADSRSKVLGSAHDEERISQQGTRSRVNLTQRKKGIGRTSSSRFDLLEVSSVRRETVSGKCFESGITNEPNALVPNEVHDLMASCSSKLSEE